MKVMSNALQDLAGNRMRRILAATTSNRIYALLSGLSLTAIIQSSSATTLMVVSFANAGLLTLTESIGVIMGANIGTTITAQIVAFKVTKAALLMTGVGFSMLFISKNEKLHPLFVHFVEHSRTNRILRFSNETPPLSTSIFPAKPF